MESDECNGTRLTRRQFVFGSVAAVGAGVSGSGPGRRSDTAPSITESAKPILYLVATAHNDTQWNWTVQSTIDNYIPKTVRLNDALFDKYPNYNFNYEGVIHYHFCKEYHPELFAVIKRRVAEGRWKLSGGWVNAVDTHVPSAESLFRQALYGQQFFRREFGMVPRDIYLPDCFGFPFSLPTIGKHSGFIAFSTQKFSANWGCFIPPPFAVGNWEGVDGSVLVTALRPGAYITKVRADPSVDAKWQDDFVTAADATVDLRYFGTGDTGGAPDEESVRWVNSAVANAGGTAIVRNTSADQLAHDLTTAQIDALPHYKGELLLKLHAVGCYTSQAAMKRWNRQNEQLGDAAERGALIAEWLGGPAYPRAALTESYLRFLWHQFHDDVTGTCIPQAYTFSWNDELISLSRFAGIIETSAGVAAMALDTTAVGVSILVYNPLGIERRDLVMAHVDFGSQSKADAVLVYDTETGREEPCQVLRSDDISADVIFLANMPSVGYKVFDVRRAHAGEPPRTELSITPHNVENRRWRVGVDANGDIDSLYDKAARRELLASPARIELLEDVSRNSPAWEITYRADTTPPRGYGEKARVKVVESGPVRVSLEITRKIGEASTLIQYIRLTPDSETVEVENHLDWKGQDTLIKAAFHTVASNPKGVFDLDLGVIERGNVADNLWEVPAHHWAGIVDSSGAHGLAILNDCKYGWDKPADDRLRLTLLHSPLAGQGRRYQGMQDVGKHVFTYALAGFDGDWRSGKIPQAGARLNQPLRAFQAPAKRTGASARTASFVRCSTDQVQIRALKKAEESEEVVVRVQELYGKPVSEANLIFSRPVVKAREMNAIEEPLGDVPLSGTTLKFDLRSFQPRTFAVTLLPLAGVGPPRRPEMQALSLPFDTAATTFDGATAAADFDGAGLSIPGELFPVTVENDGLAFSLGDAHRNNAVACNGQRITLPKIPSDRLYILASSINGDRKASFTVENADGGRIERSLVVAAWTGHVGQWCSTLDYSAPNGGIQVVKQTDDGMIENLEALHPAFVKRHRIAWVGTHRHTPTGNEAQIQCYLFQYRVDLPANAVAIVLPTDRNIRIFAALVGRNAIDATTAAQPLFAAEFSERKPPA